MSVIDELKQSLIPQKEINKKLKDKIKLQFENAVKSILGDQNNKICDFKNIRLTDHVAP